MLFIPPGFGKNDISSKTALINTLISVDLFLRYHFLSLRSYEYCKLNSLFQDWLVSVQDFSVQVVKLLLLLLPSSASVLPFCTLRGSVPKLKPTRT